MSRSKVPPAVFVALTILYSWCFSADVVYSVESTALYFVRHYENWHGTTVTIVWCICILHVKEDGKQKHLAATVQLNYNFTHAWLHADICV